MKFDFVIGNPPYQEQHINTSDKPIYNFFMEASFKVADNVELITPARFLYNAGLTPKEWNKKMLMDEHFKVLHYEPNSAKVFANTDIKGGVVITYRSKNNIYGAMETFIAYDELRQILKKVKSKRERTFDSIGYISTSYKPTDLMKEECKDGMKKMSASNRNFIASHYLDTLNNIAFFDKKPIDKYEYIQIFGRQNNVRKQMWIRKDYVSVPENFENYKLFLSEASGTGRFGESISLPEIGEPCVGCTQTFISFGNFINRYEAINGIKYVKSKFFRALLFTKKTTQHGQKEVYSNIPLQDFTNNSDIDWSATVSEIDKQLYKKYGLSENEIEFVETNVKEME